MVLLVPASLKPLVSGRPESVGHSERDPNQKGTHGEARVIGVEQEIVPEQAAEVVRIMELRAAGSRFSQISKTLNAEGLPAPRRKHKDGNIITGY